MIEALRNVAAMTAPLSLRERPHSIDLISSGPLIDQSRSYQLVEARIDALRQFKGRKVSAIGRIKDGDSYHTLYRVAVGCDRAACRVLVSAGIHGEETASVHSALCFLESTVEAYLDEIYFEVFPCINPCGFVRGRRKNLQDLDVNRGFAWESEVPEVLPVLKQLGRMPAFALVLDLHEDDNRVPDERSGEPPPDGLHAYESCQPENGIARQMISSFPQEMVFQGTNLYGDTCRQGVVDSTAQKATSIFAAGRDLEQFTFRHGLSRHSITLETCVAKARAGEMEVLPLGQRVASHQRMISGCLDELLRRKFARNSRKPHIRAR